MPKTDAQKTPNAQNGAKKSAVTAVIVTKIWIGLDCMMPALTLVTSASATENAKKTAKTAPRRDAHQILSVLNGARKNAMIVLCATTNKT